MQYQLYLRKGKVFIPTFGRVDKGLYRDIEPVVVVDVSDTGALRQALRDNCQGQSADALLPPRRSLSTTGRGQICRREKLGRVRARRVALEYQRKGWNPSDRRPLERSERLGGRPRADNQISCGSIR
jgi:hypothetical protein